MSREEFREALRAVGATYVAAVEDGADVLVVGTDPLPDKVARAEALGGEVVAWEAFAPRLRTVAGATAASAAVLPAVDLGPPLRILDVRLPWEPPTDARPPSLDAFAAYTFDAPTVLLLRALARAVRLGHPAWVEGDTATSKSSVIRLLAAACRQPLVRVNLNGQTDVSELIGRYTPHGAEWRFTEGVVPTAMRRGWWLLLDEVNLAEPSILERLNSVLERPASLVLTEGDGSRIGPDGDPVHPCFRVFATSNPSEYQGRSTMSPAWRDRFVATVHAVEPGEQEALQQLERCVYGRQPDVHHEGYTWRGSDDTPTHPSLAAAPDAAAILRRLATAHAAAVAMTSSNQPAVGGARREPYRYTRRALLAVLDACRDLELVDPRSGEAVGFVADPARVVADAARAVYVERVAGAEDQARVEAVLRAVGVT